MSESLNPPDAAPFAAAGPAGARIGRVPGWRAALSWRLSLPRLAPGLPLRLPLRLPQSLLGRLTLVMLAGVLLTQVIGNGLWAAYLRKQARQEAHTAALQLGQNVSATLRFFKSLPANYRPLMIEQLRGMGGTRLFVAVNHGPVPIARFDEHDLTPLVVQTLARSLKQDFPQEGSTRIGFAWPAQLAVSEKGTRVADLPQGWVQPILFVQPRPAPVLTIQVELEPGNWLYLAGLMPNPYFLDKANPLSPEWLLLQGLSLAAILLLSLVVVRQITRPLAALADAAAAFGTDENVPLLPATGSQEFVRTARAFNDMRERIARYLEDRERLFIAISHDLRTPITRLRLRAELLDDDVLGQEFEEDLDELDMMVKGALQCVKDSDIHETPTEVRLDALLSRMARGAMLAGHEVVLHHSGLSVMAKPLALKRAIGNLLDNALHYGHRAEITVRQVAQQIEIDVRDHGDGVPEEALPSLFEPYVRLEAGRAKNSHGMGLGLGIARGIVQAQGGQLRLSNHAEGGLCARIILPRAIVPVPPD